MTPRPMIPLFVFPPSPPAGKIILVPRMEAGAGGRVELVGGVRVGGMPHLYSSSFCISNFHLVSPTLGSLIFARLDPSQPSRRG